MIRKILTYYAERLEEYLSRTHRRPEGLATVGMIGNSTEERPIISGNMPRGGTAALRLFARRTDREQYGVARRRIPVADRQRQPHGGGERTAVDAGQRKPDRRDEQRVPARRCHWCQS